jgi:hypothetical protein
MAGFFHNASFAKTDRGQRAKLLADCRFQEGQTLPERLADYSEANIPTAAAMRPDCASLKLIGRRDTEIMVSRELVQRVCALPRHRPRNPN